MFRRATADDRVILDEMTLAGARHWGHDKVHPEAYAGLVEQLAAEEGPEASPVFVLEEHGEVVAFYELRDRGDHVELLRMFMRTDLIGQGYGRMLWTHAVEQGALMHDRAKPDRTIEVAPGFSLGLFWYDFRPPAQSPLP